METNNVALLMVTIFMILPLVLLFLFNWAVLKKLELAIGILTQSIALIVMGVFIGTILFIALTLIYIGVLAMGVDGLWKFHFEQYLFENDIVSSAFLVIFVLSGAAQYILMGGLNQVTNEATETESE